MSVPLFGAISPLKSLVFVALPCPALLQAEEPILGPPLPEPTAETIRVLGRWAAYFLLASLAVTPLRQGLAWPGLISVRRMLGLASFAYAIGHFFAFVADKGFDLERVASEIALRTNYAIGAVGLVVLALLAATSTDAMVRRLGGKRWRYLHRAAYLAAAAAVTHYFLHVKADLAQPMLLAGFALWLLLYRMVLWTRGSTVASRPMPCIAHAAAGRAAL
jgi:sulfoxide reductase heme-binding subunit YedZ